MNRWWSKQRFDLLELLFVVAFSIAASSGYWIQRTALGVESIPSEALWLPSGSSKITDHPTTRGTSKNSLSGTSSLIERDGFFVDVGAGDYRFDSKTFYLDERLGWRGIAVDPLRELEANYRKSRPRTRLFALFVSDVSGNRARVFLADRVGEHASASRDSAALQDGNITEITVPTITGPLGPARDSAHRSALDRRRAL